jgi:hypothetical protein
MKYYYLLSNLLNSDQKKYFFKIIIIIFVGILFEILSIGLIFPVLSFKSITKSLNIAVFIFYGSLEIGPVDFILISFFATSFNGAAT